MTHDEIKELAELARLDLSEEETQQYQKDFEGILDYISTINSVPTEASKEPVRGNTVNRMREDDSAYDSGEFTKDLLDAAPRTEEPYIKVDKIL